MKLYQVYWQTEDSDGAATMACEWAGTQADAKRIKNAHKAEEAEVQEVDVPTSKPELLAWLNRNLARPSGA